MGSDVPRGAGCAPAYQFGRCVKSLGDARLRLYSLRLYTVTEILLIAGILSALTAAWWGGLSDRRGRRLILAATSMTDIVTNVVMILSVPVYQILEERANQSGAIQRPRLSLFVRVPMALGLRRPFRTWRRTTVSAGPGARGESD